MDITRDQQLALDDALVAPANRLKIGKSNLRLSSDLNSKEATLQVMYDVLKLTPFYKAFQITTNVLEIYMQEEMLQICPKLPDQLFEELPFEEEILTFLRDLGHSEEIKVITDINVKKLHQPWRSFDVGMYHKKNVDYAYLLWEDFVYQVENKNIKRINEMYYPRFTKVVSRHEDTQLYGAILPNELTNEAIKDSESYKEYYAIASGAEPLKTKASVKKKQARSDKAPKATKGKILKETAKVTKPSKKKLPDQGLETLSEVALTEEEQMRIVTKRSLNQFHSSHASESGMNEGTGVTPGVFNVPKYGSDEEQISWKSSSNKDDDAERENDDDDDADNQDDDDKEEDSFDPRVQTPSHVESTYDEDNDEEIQGANVKGEELDEEETNEEDNANELYRDVNVNLEGRDTEMTDALRTIIQTTQVIEDTHVIITPVNPEDVSVTTIAELPLLSTTILPLPPTPLITHLQQTPVPTPATVPSSSLQDLPNFVSSIPCVIDAYLGNKMHEAIKTNVQLNKLDDNIKKIIKDQVKEQVKAQVSKILPKIKKTINEQLKAEVMTRSSNKSKTSHDVAANLSELELKKILIDKMESNKSIHISDEQKNLYKALVDAYESDKLILDMYGDTVSFKRHRDDEDKDEEPFVGSNRGSKRRRAGKEPESTSAPKEKNSKTTGKSTEGSKSHHKSADKSAQTEEPMHTAKDLEEPAHQEFVTGDTEDKPDKETSQHPNCTLAQKEDTCDSFNELMDTPLDFSAFVINRLKVDNLTPKLLVGPTFDLTKGSYKSLVELEYFFEEVYKATTNQLDWNNPEGQQYPHDLRKPLALIPNSQSRQVIPFDHFINNDLAYWYWILTKGQKQSQYRQNRERNGKSVKKGPHATFQCQPLNQNFYNSNSFGFDQSQPPQFPVIHQPPQEMSIQDMEDLKQQYLDEMKSLINTKDYRDEKIDIKINELKENFNGISIEINKKKKLQQLEQVASPSQFFNSFCYDDDDDDDDEEYTTTITPDSPKTDSLIMVDKHLDTIPETESNEFVKSSVENLVQNPSESEGDCECDVLDCDDSQTNFFSTFSNPLFDDSTSSDDKSSHEEVIYEMSFKTYSNLLFDLDEEIISSEFNLIHNEDLDSTLKMIIDFLFDEFAGELITIPPRIVNREHEEYISLLERLLYDNSSPRPPEDFHANPNTIIKSLPTFPIPVEDSDSLREEINIFLGRDDSIPSGIESDDYDSEGDDNFTSLPEFESFHVDYPDSGDSTIDVVEDIPVDVPNILPTYPTLHMDFHFIPSHNELGSDLDVSSPSEDRNKIYDLGICIEVESTRFLATLSPVIDTLLPFSSKNENKVFNHGVLASKEKSPPSSSYRGFKASKLFHHKSLMLIHGENIPLLDVPFLYFYPP
ncbi:hypothetical protein Tco_1514536 [Tanacetum coccineum]